MRLSRQWLRTSTESKTGSLDCRDLKAFSCFISISTRCARRAWLSETFHRSMQTTDALPRTSKKLTNGPKIWYPESEDPDLFAERRSVCRKLSMNRCARQCGNAFCAKQHGNLLAWALIRPISI